MFSKALREHPQPSLRQQQQRKPLFAQPSALNVAASSSPGLAVGTKRKYEMAPYSTTTQSNALESLHEAVYFDENDFDDDDMLDLGGASEVFDPTKTTETATPVTVSTRAETPKSPPLPEQTVSVNDAAVPPSSAPLPWSSSPPAHYLPPPKRRTLPWLEQNKPPELNRGPEPKPPATSRRDEEKKANRARKPKATGEENKADTAKSKVKSETKVDKTPANKKTTYPWNTTMSALKAEQKELRKQQKRRVTTERKVNERTIQPEGKLAPIFLSEEQKHVLDVIVNQGKSVFFTGSAGTGKSVLMREVIKRLREKYRKEPDRVAVTASTGLAACNIEGVTLHSFAGVGLGKESATELLKKIKRNQKSRTRWLRTKVLIIDEISMVDGDFFDKLEEIARKIRNNGRPFGGIQLVVTGDFFQLPPVPENGREAKFAFSAATWDTSIQHTILLTHVFRQKDPEFANMLNEMRLGRLTPASIAAFKKLSRPLDFHDSLEATELFPTRTEVDNANAARMARLSGEVMTFTAVDSGSIKDVPTRDKLLANCMAPPVIQLKKGAQVMLIKNMDDTLVNGSLGKVVAFMDEATFDYYHKHEEDFYGDSGDEGAGIARARKKIRGMGLDPKNGGISTARLWPLVSFIQPDGTERHLLCQPESWKIELPNGEVQAQRQQVPLILAWALSIHKAQGQTLQRVKVDLGRVFERGQAYVALSRATSQAGLQVTRFDPSKVMVHPKVVEFYRNLTSVKQIREEEQMAKQLKQVPPPPPAVKQDPKPIPLDDVEELSDFEDDLQAMAELYG
ncbi:hypothetical protein VTO42DRAFT_8564 [Malbranchea cinnamomea]